MSATVIIEVRLKSRRLRAAAMVVCFDGCRHTLPARTITAYFAPSRFPVPGASSGMSR
jgi:hypothetical protein